MSVITYLPNISASEIVEGKDFPCVSGRKTTEKLLSDVHRPKTTKGNGFQYSASKMNIGHIVPLNRPKQLQMPPVVPLKEN